MRSPAFKGPADGPVWSNHNERGSGFWVQIALWGIRCFRPGCIRVFLPAVALYYFLVDRAARRSSQEYLSRVAEFSGKEQAPRLRDTYAHLYTFAQIILDRFTLWSGRADTFDVVYHGRRHMQSLLDQGKGAMLIGAHLGNFDVLRLIAREAKIPVNVLMYVENAQLINEAFQKLDSESMIRVINVSSNSAHMAFQIRECVKRGEFVAVLSDRVGPNAKKRVSRLEFLGEEAPFPESPFSVAMLMELPVIFTVALKRGPKNYEVFMEEISDGQIDAGISRKEAVLKHMARFVSRLEHYCLSDPLQWFNFFDFWSGDTNAKE